MDITQLILDDHHEQRRLFAILDELRSAERRDLQAVWARLSALLILHAEAEERFFYPALLQVGHGAGTKDSAAAETKDAIKDHNKLRQALARAAAEEVGTEAWHEATGAAREENSDHMGEEEREGLADFRRHATLQERHDLGVAFAVFEAQHALGVTAVDKEPKKYIAEHTPG